MTGRVCGNRLGLVLCALGFVACNTYDDSLLVGTLGASEPAGGNASDGGSAGANAAGGRAQPGGAGKHESGGAPDDAGAGGTGDEAGESAGGNAGALATAGSSGTAGVAGSLPTAGNTSVAGGTGTAGSGGYELIDDFEDQDGFVLPVHKRNGPWYTFSDATAGKLGAFTIALLTGTNVHDDSTAALHLTASGFSDWGAGVGCDLVNLAAKKVPYDVSAYKGVRFYAKVASGTPTTLKFLVTTTYSDPDGGKCNDAVTGKRCSDHLFRAVSGIKTTWASYEVMFADLTQQGFGLVQAGLDPTSVYSLQFTMVTKLQPADLWIDDLSFILK